jgi:hypothetical protein
VLDQKPAIYYYFTISPNLMYISTLKRRVGLEKIFEFLKKILLSLSISRNADIELYFNEEFSQNPDPPAPTDVPTIYNDSAMKTEPPSPPSDFPLHIHTFLSKSADTNFLLERMMKACLKIIKFLHPFKSSDNEFEEIKILQDIIYSLAIKITTTDPTCTNIRNFIFILSSMIRNIEHH